MIQKKELRIGNLVMWNPKLTNPDSTLSPLHIEVFEIMQDKIEYVFPNIENRQEPFEDDIAQKGTRTKQFNELEPIILSAEILEHSGFKKISGLLKSTYYEKGKFQLEIIEDGFSIRDFNSLKVPLKYLHQLQNIYFLVSGEELDIDHFW